MDPSAPGVYITVFAASDIDGIVAIENTCFQHAWRRESFETELNIANAGGYVARDIMGGAIAGYIVFRTFHDEMHILKLATGLAWRRRNIAYALIQKAMETARANRISDIFLEVRASNKPAIAVYKKAGFAVNGIRKGYYAEGDDALMMINAGF
ncbi:MAG: ribosomal protein S18-alanine N-acetyltransferase [Thermodesulfobacteriota bacterium]|nr:ribosomal protein S18-alanine N-acetyltransferase [Thermodesulfobacteriota bacterium]